MKALLSAGAIVDTEDEQGDTPFVLAFRGQHLEVMEALHEAGKTTGRHSVCLTFRGQHLEVMEALHEAGKTTGRHPVCLGI